MEISREKETKENEELEEERKGEKDDDEMMGRR